MRKIIISDTSCLILLDKINEIDILKKLYEEVVVTTTILDEFGKPLPEWIRIVDPQNISYQNILNASVDKGEASAIALALEQKDSLLIVDDYKARQLATGLGLKITGTLGVIVEAKLSGRINSVSDIISKIKTTNFRISPDLEKKILGSAGE